MGLQQNTTKIPTSGLMGKLGAILGVVMKSVEQDCFNPRDELCFTLI